MWILLLLSSILLFVLGTAIGSFINVVVFRTIETPADFPGESWKRGRSRCDHCGRVLHWYENIPLLAYLLQRGRTRCCDQPLSITHPVVELLTGSLFVWWFWGGAFFFQLASQPFSLIQPLFWLLVGVLLLIIVVVDVLYLKIPQWTLVGLTALALLYRGSLGIAGIMQPQDLFTMGLATVGTAGGFFLVWLITRGRGLGWGDVELAVPMTLLVGWPNILVAVYAAVVSGAVVGLVMIGLGKARFGRPIPFGPFLILGTLVALLWGDLLWQWYWQLF